MITWDPAYTYTLPALGSPATLNNGSPTAKSGAPSPVRLDPTARLAPKKLAPGSGTRVRFGEAEGDVEPKYPYALPDELVLRPLLGAPTSRSEMPSSWKSPEARDHPNHSYGFPLRVRSVTVLNLTPPYNT